MRNNMRPYFEIGKRNPMADFLNKRSKMMEVAWSDLGLFARYSEYLALLVSSSYDKKCIDVVIKTV